MKKLITLTFILLSFLSYGQMTVNNLRSTALFNQNGSNFLDVQTARNLVVNDLKAIVNNMGAYGYYYAGAGLTLSTNTFSITSPIASPTITTPTISSPTITGTATTSVIATYSVTEAASGLGVVFPKETFQGRTATTFTATSTVGADTLAKGLLVVSSGTCTLTLPTGTALDTQTGAGDGYSFDVIIENTANGGTLTIAANTGIVAASAVTGGTTLTLSNSATVGIGTLHFVHIGANGSNKWIVSRIQ